MLYGSLVTTSYAGIGRNHALWTLRFRAFMDMMVADHKSTIDLFRDASDDDIAPEVKSFILATIPKLESHLAKADSLQKALK